MSNLPKQLEKYNVFLEPDAKLTYGYIARAMVLASMPHSEQQGTYFERKNGNYTLAMQANETIGLPYGPIPRLVLAWITTEAVRTKERTLYLGKNLTEFMRHLDIVPTGGKTGSITMLKEQMKRLFTTAIQCSYSKNNEDEHVYIDECPENAKNKRRLRGKSWGAGLQISLVEEYNLLWWDKEGAEQVEPADTTKGPTQDRHSELAGYGLSPHSRNGFRRSGARHSGGCRLSAGY